jgi:hypothetical protein
MWIKYEHLQTVSMPSEIEGKQCFCQITMTYRSDTISSTYSHNAKRDEVTIFQEISNDHTSVVFKGFLKAGGKILFVYSIFIFGRIFLDKFSFKSQRSVHNRFQLILCVNDLIDSRISSCCEYRYRHGARIGGDDGIFWIQKIVGVTICSK